MSYDIEFKVKVEGIDKYIPIGNCIANVTWNIREMIMKSTGLPWENEKNNGLCVDIIPSIEKGLSELNNNPDKYKQYEAKNGWGTIEGCKRFFEQILSDWNDFVKDSSSELVAVTTFWIV